MQFKAMIVGDVSKPWSMEGRNGVTRKLSCVEALSVTSGRMAQQVFVKIPHKGDKQGDPDQGATLLGMNVVLDLTAVKQNHETKEVEFTGEIVEVVSQMQESAFKAAPAPAPGKAQEQGK